MSNESKRMSFDEEIIKRILHIVDQKFGLYEINLQYGQLVDAENTVNNQSDGFHMGLYSSVQSKKEEFEKHQQMIQEDITELLTLLTKGELG